MSAPAWTPPHGMLSSVASDWRRFYRECWVNYGITPEQYRALYLAQMGRCFICQKARGKHPDDPKGGGSQRLGIDHSHLIGGGRADAVRALLCTLGSGSCNWIIGRLDGPALNRAVTVLRDMPAQGVFALMDPTDEELMAYAHPSGV